MYCMYLYCVYFYEVCIIIIILCVLILHALVLCILILHVLYMTFDMKEKIDCDKAVQCVVDTVHPHSTEFGCTVSTTILLLKAAWIGVNIISIMSISENICDSSSTYVRIRKSELDHNYDVVNSFHRCHVCIHHCY